MLEDAGIIFQDSVSNETLLPHSPHIWITHKICVSCCPLSASRILSLFDLLCFSVTNFVINMFGNKKKGGALTNFPYLDLSRLIFFTGSFTHSRCSDPGGLDGAVWSFGVRRPKPTPVWLHWHTAAGEPEVRPTHLVLFMIRYWLTIAILLFVCFLTCLVCQKYLNGIFVVSYHLCKIDLCKWWLYPIQKKWNLKVKFYSLIKFAFLIHWNWTENGDKKDFKRWLKKRKILLYGNFLLNVAMILKSLALNLHLFIMFCAYYSSAPPQSGSPGSRPGVAARRPAQEHSVGCGNCRLHRPRLQTDAGKPSVLSDFSKLSVLNVWKNLGFEMS